jgi:Transcriptional regulatory protein, C terminal
LARLVGNVLRDFGFDSEWFRTVADLPGERDILPFGRSIDVRISGLRRKIEADPPNPKLIKTVFGAGYLFSAEVPAGVLLWCVPLLHS